MIYFHAGNRRVLRELARQLGYTDLAGTDRDLGQAAESESWLDPPATADRHRGEKVTIHGARQRVWALPLDRYLTVSDEPAAETMGEGNDDA